MIEKDGNTIAVVLTAASAMAAGVSVYTMATSEEGQKVLQPVVFSFENDNEEFNNNYFISETKQTPKMSESFLQEAMALANSILSPLGKQQAAPLVEEEIVIESAQLATPVQDNVSLNSTPLVTTMDMDLLSGSPIEESQTQNVVQHYGQTKQGPLEVSDSTPSISMTSLNPTTLALNTSSLNSSTTYQMTNQGIVPTVATHTSFINSTMNQEAMAQEFAQDVPSPFVNEALSVEEPESMSEMADQTVQTIVMDDTGEMDAMVGPALAEEGTFMAMAEVSGPQANFEEGALSIQVEEVVAQAPGTEIPEPLPSDPEPEPEPIAPQPSQDPAFTDPQPEPQPDLQPEPEPEPQPEPEPMPDALPMEPEAPAPAEENDPSLGTTNYGELNARIAEEALKLVDNTNGLWCTQVVQMAMANAGVQDALNLWPNEFCDMYGYYTSDPQPGNLIYYNQGGNGLDHIAIYIGNGQAVHGNYWIDGESKTVIANAKLQDCDDYAFIQVER